MITVTPEATEKINEILSDEKEKYVRAFISGGGCAGFNYGFTLENEANEDDFVIDKLLVDAMSMQYFEGAIIDYTDDKLQGAHFVIKNPNATTTCGCGNSFSI